MLTNHQNQEKNKIITSLRENKLRPTVMQGLAGTGKTFTIPFIMDDLNITPQQTLFVAYTGTAVLTMQQDNAMTLHSLLYKPILRFGKVVGFRKRDLSDFEEMLMGIRLIIMDEMSMTPAEIMKDVEQICHVFNIKLLLVGDFFQLPQIGEPHPYLQIFDGKLEKPMRQALDSPILTAAHKIRHGEFLTEGLHGDSLFIGRKNNIDTDWLHPSNQWICGLNATREKLNKQMADNRDIPIIGDKIIFLKNSLEEGVSNGTRGEILSMKQHFDLYEVVVQTNYNEIVTVKATWKREPTTQERKMGYRTHFDFAYAITCHKSQGATLEKGVIVDESFYFGREDKEIALRWKYTALTRYKNKCVLLR